MSGHRPLPSGVVVPFVLAALALFLLSIATIHQMSHRRRDVLGLLEEDAPAAWPLAALLIVAFGAIVLFGTRGGRRGKDRPHGGPIVGNDGGGFRLRLSLDLQLP